MLYDICPSGFGSITIVIVYIFLIAIISVSELCNCNLTVFVYCNLLIKSMCNQSQFAVVIKI